MRILALAESSIQLMSDQASDSKDMINISMLLNCNCSHSLARNCGI